MRWRSEKMALSEVSVRLAFSSPSHFSRVFKRYVGTTPKEYRDRHW